MLPASMLTLSATDAFEGDEVTATASGFVGNVAFELHSTPINLGTALANSVGIASVTAKMPTGVIGVHTVTATGKTVAGQTVTLTAPINISPMTAVTAVTSTPSVGLAFTGADIFSLAIVGVALIGAGSPLTRRRRTR
jgi:hexosaminidase